MKAHFKTGHGQRELPIDCVVSAEVAVGDLVKLTGDGTEDSPFTIAPAAGLTDATHLVAQSDFTMGHYIRERGVDGVPEYLMDRIYSDKVAVSTELKKVALFDISDKTDILVE